MRLTRIFLRNFKGIREFTIQAYGNDLSIFGANATCKSTIGDALSWATTDKNSQGKSTFQIKTIDPVTKKVIPMLEHEVCAVFKMDDGSDLELKKILVEKYDQDRGIAGDKVTAHTTNHFINGVDITERDYKAWLASICEEKRLRLLTNCTYFNEQIEWPERRALLLELDNVTDAEVIASEPKLSELRAMPDLPTILHGNKIDFHRKSIMGRRKECEKQKSGIPLRIDEVNRATPEPAGQVPDTAPLSEQRDKLGRDRAEALAGGAVAPLTIKLGNLQSEEIRIKNRIRSEASQSFEQAQQDLRSEGANLSEVQSKRSALQSEVESEQRKLGNLEREVAEKLAEHSAEKARALEYSAKDSCPACGQALPAEKVQAAKSKAESEFNELKAKRLESIVAAGRSLRASANTTKEAISKLQQSVAAIDEGLPALRRSYENCKAQVAGAVAPEIDFSECDEIVANQAAQAKVQRDIEELRSGSTKAIEDLDAKILRLSEQIAEADRLAGIVSQRMTCLKRIDELKKEEKLLGSEIEKIDRELFLWDLFIRTKVKMLTQRIESHFSITSFKLFEENITNEGIQQCCEAMIDGRPYSTLSTSEKIKVGLDVISAFSRFYNFAPPIVIDNCESILELPKTTGQQIRLIVERPKQGEEEPDEMFAARAKSLRFEIDGQQPKATPKANTPKTRKAPEKAEEVPDALAF